MDKDAEIPDYTDRFARKAVTSRQKVLASLERRGRIGTIGAAKGGFDVAVFNSLPTHVACSRLEILKPWAPRSHGPSLIAFDIVPR